MNNDELFDTPDYLYHLETYDLPYGCPYRQTVPFGPGPGFGGAQGPGPAGQQGPPSSPPPNFTPAKNTKSAQGPGASTKFIDQGAIRPCVFRFVYIWPTRGQGFWAWLTYVGRRSVAGFQWNGRRWVYFGMDLRKIDSFQCF